MSVVQPDKRPLLVAPLNSAPDGRYRAKRTPKALAAQWGPEKQITRIGNEHLWAAAEGLTPSDVYEARTIYVYFVREVDGPIKIGRAMDPMGRLQNLQVGNPRELYMLSWVKARKDFERVLHQHLAEHRLGGEWYAAVWQVFEAVDTAEAIYGPTHRHECAPCAREFRLIEAGRDPDSLVNADRHTCGTWPFRDRNERLP